jgi:hypothetical protein
MQIAVIGIESYDLRRCENDELPASDSTKSQKATMLG